MEKEKKEREYHSCVSLSLSLLCSQVLALPQVLKYESAPEDGFSHAKGLHG